MSKKRVARTRAGGRWTESRYWGFIRSLLRRGFSKYPPKYDVLNAAKQASRAKRYKWKYRCANCKKLYPMKEISVDHIEPCGSLRSYEDLPGFVARLYCESEGLQVLCTACHKVKTDKDNKSRK